VEESEKNMGVNSVSPEEEQGKEKEKEDVPVRKFRGIPEDVQLFEVFWKQVLELIKVTVRTAITRISDVLTMRSQARPDLSIQDITVLLVYVTNLSLRCYVDQILAFAHGKITEYSERYVLFLYMSVCLFLTPL
jgi:vacuolar protein sorting-associated protein 35